MLSGANFVYFCMVLDLQKSMWSSDFIYPVKLFFLVLRKGQGLVLSTDMALIKGRRQVYNARLL